MVSAGRVQTLLTCAKAPERPEMLPDGFSVGCFRLVTRLRPSPPFLYCKRSKTGGGNGLGTRLRILYTYVTPSGDIRYDNRSYAVVVQRKSCTDLLMRKILRVYPKFRYSLRDLTYRVSAYKIKHAFRENTARQGKREQVSMVSV